MCAEFDCIFKFPACLTINITTFNLTSPCLWFNLMIKALLNARSLLTAARWKTSDTGANSSQTVGVSARRSRGDGSSENV